MPFLARSPYAVVKAEVAFDSGFATLEGDRTWTDVTNDCDSNIGASITYGRSDEQSQPTPNQLTVTLNNDDGRYTPGNASSPLYPNVKKGKPIRLSVTYGNGENVRFTGYIDEWSAAWPDGGEEMCQVQVTAVSRRARLGQTAPLTSAIRAAYLATSPLAYWPMTETADVTDLAGRQAFRDVTNDASAAREREFIGSFYDTAGHMPIVQDGSQGPTDETSLVRFPLQTNLAYFEHYVGAGNAISINSAGELTVEAVARVTGSIDVLSIASIFAIYSADLQSSIEFLVASDGVSDPAKTGGGINPTYYEESTGTLYFTNIVSLYNADLFAAATDGQIHHYAVTLTGGNVARSYFDGQLVQTGTLNSSKSFLRRFTQITMGALVYQCTMWGGHMAAHNVALTADQIAVRAAAATAAGESDAERVVRVAGRIGVPSAEIDAETSVAATLGPQAEAGRSAAEVLDELATSTRGVLYDTRDGHLALQARNHRYNQTAAFTLKATDQEIGVDMTATVNDRYLTNSVEFSRVGDSAAVPATVSDSDSIEEYGVYSTSLQIVSSSDEETRAAAQDLIFRFADAGATPRVSAVTVDISDLNEEQRTAVLDADIGTLFNLAGLPVQAPSDPMPLYFEGYTETLTTDGHTLTINTTPGGLHTNVASTAAPALTNSGVTTAY